jgi:hypothetical protein
MEFFGEASLMVRNDMNETVVYENGRSWIRRRRYLGCSIRDTRYVLRSFGPAVPPSIGVDAA